MGIACAIKAIPFLGFAEMFWCYFPKFVDEQIDEAAIT